VEKRLGDAQFYLELNDKQKAYEIYKAIVNENPNSFEAWYGIALCIEDNDRKEYCLQRALQINPNNQEAKNLYNQLRNIGRNVDASKPMINNINASAPQQSFRVITNASRPNNIPRQSNLPTTSLNYGSKPPDKRGSSKQKKPSIGIIGALLLVAFSIIGLVNILIPASSVKSDLVQSPVIPVQSSSSLLVIGSWYDTWVVPCTKVITKSGSTYYLTTKYNDGSEETVILQEYYVGGEQRFIYYSDTRYGDYLVIENDGNLAFYDNEGFIYSDKPQ
jgi:hypothetical protein